MKIYIRDANIDDLVSLDSLLNELLDYEAKRYKRNLKQKFEIEDQFKQIINDKKAHIIVAENEEKSIIGYLYGFYILSFSNVVSTANIADIYIKKEYRYQGIGTLLLNNFIAWAIANKMEYITITAFEENIEALSLYKKIGFKNYKKTLLLDIKS